MIITMVTIPWSCYLPWRPRHGHALFHDEHDMILTWSYYGEYASPWSYHVIAWSFCLTMVVTPASNKPENGVFAFEYRRLSLSSFHPYIFVGSETFYWKRTNPNNFALPYFKTWEKKNVSAVFGQLCSGVCLSKHGVATTFVGYIFDYRKAEEKVLISLWKTSRQKL